MFDDHAKHIVSKTELIDSDGKTIVMTVYKGWTVYRNSDQQYHRIGGPAYIWHDNGDCSWWQNGTMHRENGPAIINKDSDLYFLHGEEMSKEKFYKRMVKRRIQNG